MNRVLWRVTKVLLFLVVVVICIMQLSVLNSPYQSNHPFPVNDARPAEVAFTNKLIHDHAKDLSANIRPPLLTRKNTSDIFNDILLRKPQQFYDYNRTQRNHLWPDSAKPDDDRIISQMTYTLPKESKQNIKTILVYNGLRDGMREGQHSFKSLKCPVDQCHITGLRDKADQADHIIWHEHLSRPMSPRPPQQIWTVFLLESPYHTISLSSWKNQINWTATYRSDSTIVAPYERFTYFNTSITKLPLAKNYAADKKKKVAWFVSNCGARNNRLGYAQELAKHIEVDIYGACGTFSCPRSTKTDCFDLLSSTYKFYLAFENSNCRDYITEKFFVNGLKNDVIPIVMGAHPDDYKKAAPRHSYIHVDDFESPELLAQYLHELDQDNDKYNEYFRWKGTGDNINAYFWCRMCAMTHAASDLSYSHVYEDIEEWWRGQGVCQEKRDGAYLWPKWV